MAERIGKPEIAAVGVYNVDEGGVGPSQVAVIARVHVQWISRVQAGDSSYLKARTLAYSFVIGAIALPLPSPPRPSSPLPVHLDRLSIETSPGARRGG